MTMMTGKHTAPKLFPLKSNQFFFLLGHTFLLMESTVEGRSGSLFVT